MGVLALSFENIVQKNNWLMLGFFTPHSEQLMTFFEGMES